MIPPHVQAQIDAGFAMATAQLELIRVLRRRALKLHMREMLRELHKSPYLLPGQWEQMLETYRMCFRGRRFEETE